VQHLFLLFKRSAVIVLRLAAVAIGCEAQSWFGFAATRTAAGATASVPSPGDARSV
jgi:hypothetical protein